MPTVSQQFSSEPTKLNDHSLILIPFPKTIFFSFSFSMPTTINCLALHHNILYAASSNQIHVFDLSDYTHVDTFNDDSSSGSVKSMAFQNTKLFTAHQDSKIRIWQITSSKRHRLLSVLPTVKDRLHRFILPKNYVRVRRHQKKLWIEHYDAVSGLVVGGGGLVYSSSWDRSFKVWCGSELRCLESVKAHNDAVNAIAVSDDGMVYTASADGTVRVWERDEKERKHSMVTTLDKHKSTVNALALNGDGTALFSGSCDCSIMVWGRETDGGISSSMVFVEELRGHAGAVLCLTTVDDLLISGSSDRTVRIWRRGKDGEFHCMGTLEGHEQPVKCLVAVWDGESNGVVLKVCSGSLGGEIKLWEVSVLPNLIISSRSLCLIGSQN
ncbi:protein JINGUBANG-like [Ziziphus jujuba]|uniref:Protein JINGUBANG-like n=1 Tax=Ziziphus jujuba TaxID=326968 RepID=A0A6P4A9G4_ZIZJJ|nr:protein JINGUBANG-like [Ziziphus jujuba]